MKNQLNSLTNLNSIMNQQQHTVMKSLNNLTSSEQRLTALIENKMQNGSADLLKTTKTSDCKNDAAYDYLAESNNNTTSNCTNDYSTVNDSTDRINMLSKCIAKELEDLNNNLVKSDQLDNENMKNMNKSNENNPNDVYSTNNKFKINENQNENYKGLNCMVMNELEKRAHSLVNSSSFSVTPSPNRLNNLAKILNQVSNNTEARKYPSTNQLNTSLKALGSLSKITNLNTSFNNEDSDDLKKKKLIIKEYISNNKASGILSMQIKKPNQDGKMFPNSENYDVHNLKLKSCLDTDSGRHSMSDSPCSIPQNSDTTNETNSTISNASSSASSSISSNNLNSAKIKQQKLNNELYSVKYFKTNNENRNDILKATAAGTFTSKCILSTGNAVTLAQTMQKVQPKQQQQQQQLHQNQTQQNIQIDNRTAYKKRSNSRSRDSDQLNTSSNNLKSSNNNIYKHNSNLSINKNYGQI